MPPQDPKDPRDPKSFLLPKKEGPSPASAQRVNAGELLAQEQTAAAAGLTPPEPKPAPTPAAPVPPPPAPTVAPTPAQVPPAPQVEEPTIKPLQTFKSDIEGVVAGGASVVSIAAAEAKKKDEQRAAPAAAPATSSDSSIWSKVAMIGGGVLLLALALGIGVYLFTRPTTVPVAEQPVAPFIAVDNSNAVIVPGNTREEVMTELMAARQRTALSLGLVEWLYVAHAPVGEAAPQQFGAQELLSTLSRTLPEAFLRAARDPYLLGIHSFDENQAFLILSVDSYESAYAGMLSWERTMQQDLSPLFLRTPSPKTPTVVATTTATSAATASTTPVVEKFIQTSFSDKVVENHDARVLLNEQGDILLLWTFLGRNTVVITTNEYTLREVISRMQTAPVVPTL